MRSVNVERLGRLARMLRVRQRLTQVALAARAGVGRRAVSLLENGRANALRLREVEAIVASLGGRVDMRLLWNGPELDRLLDEAHAALGASVKRRLERWGWLVRVEVSYSHFGERGRIEPKRYPTRGLWRWTLLALKALSKTSCAIRGIPRLAMARHGTRRRGAGTRPRYTSADPTPFRRGSRAPA